MITKRQQYVDAPFFISPNRFTGDLNLVKDSSAIKQSLKNILLSNQGVRPFDYLFGTDVYKSLFENMTTELMFELQVRIATRLKTYDDRIFVRDVILNEEYLIGGDANTLRIDVYYEIPILDINDVISISISRNR